MTCASSDSGGGAGVQADLKAFAALGVYGFCAVSAVTAQNSHEVTRLDCLPPECFRAQLEAVASDFRVDAVKVGLLGSPANARELSLFLDRSLPGVPAVVDPVMVSAAGHAFLDGPGTEALRGLLGRAFLATPNVPEAETLSGMPIGSPEDALEAAGKILAMGPENVLVKGGHLRGDLSEDLLVGKGRAPVRLALPRRISSSTHGTGCTLSSAIAALLARGRTLQDAVREAKLYVWEAMDPARAPDLGGRGPGPVNHFCRYYGFRRKA
ncbi:MAG: bifunctional hydroxymethylpyrimidine kinase/phosphomethylpyrimidine kinase [Deltaproteobacteria bacterium]|jgi:hydroxymethylpyrimidine/phosphomethylpyrimidine kinase|nr:bifunctional hydroxymethylpyrimidine kinase/phosphomethylpyrimidine kinase [Deltaproteobacteria bacterium]